jgi:hypothetical protein
MGFSGQISIFGTVEHRQIFIFFEQLWRTFDAPRLAAAFTMKYYSWDRYDEVYTRFGPMGPPMKYLKDPSLEDIAHLTRLKNRSVSVMCEGTTPRAAEVCREVESIGEHIVDRFTPWQMLFKLGPHDFCYNAMDYIEYVGSGNICLQLYGPGSPLNWRAARELIPQLPSVQRLAREVEQIIGSEVQVLASWGG